MTYGIIPKTYVWDSLTVRQMLFPTSGLLTRPSHSATGRVRTSVQVLALPLLTLIDSNDDGKRFASEMRRKVLQNLRGCVLNDFDFTFN